MTYGEELIAQGRAMARVEVVESFLSVGVTWEVIEATTGLTEAGLQALKAQVSQKKPVLQGRDPISREFLRAEEDVVALGRAKGRVEVVEGFRRAGVTWDVIDAATGLVTAGFDLVKAQSSQPIDSLITVLPAGLIANWYGVKGDG